jgi:NTP pyrophosphatase (non-canonical NTP hydrolase)
MTFDEYQELALETAVYPDESAIAYTTLGLCSEAGEVADKLKKIIRDGASNYDEDFYTSVAKELGDVLWYVAALAHEMGFTMSEVAEMNYNKLKDRHQRNKIGGSGDER